MVGDISNPLIAEIVTGVETTLHTNGYSMLLTNSLGDPLLDAAHIALLSQRRVDGLVISVLDETHPDARHGSRELDIPVVLLDRNLTAEIAGQPRTLRPPQRDAGGRRSTCSTSGTAGSADLGAAVRPALERRVGLEEAFAARGLPPTYTVDEGVVLGRARRRGDAALLDRPSRRPRSSPAATS